MRRGRDELISSRGPRKVIALELVGNLTLSARLSSRESSRAVRARLSAQKQENLAEGSRVARLVQTGRRADYKARGEEGDTGRDEHERRQKEGQKEL